jgi:GT2 family glycosyltransferase
MGAQQNSLRPAKLSGQSVIIVSYNSASTMTGCLHSVLLTFNEGDEVIVVDNASQDNTVKIVEGFLTQTSRLKLIQCQENTGFSRGCNIGLFEAKGQYLTLLNPDTVVSPRWLEKLARVAQDPKVGAAGPLSDNVGGNQSLVFHLPPGVRFNEIQDHLTEKYSGQTETTKILFGMCLMVRRDVFNKVGLLDENLFLGNDDLEFSWRLRTHGLELKIVKDVFVHHQNHVSFGSISQAQKDEWITQSAAALKAKLRAYYGYDPTDEEVWGVKF